MGIPLNDKSEFLADDSKAKEWGQLFPAVDIPQELRKMRAWAQANPTRRKTRRGIERHIVAWLSRAQDRPRSPATPRVSAAEEAKRRHRERGRTIDGEWQEVAPNA